MIMNAERPQEVYKIDWVSSGELLAQFMSSHGSETGRGPGFHAHNFNECSSDKNQTRTKSCVS